MYTHNVTRVMYWFKEMAAQNEVIQMTVSHTYEFYDDYD